MSCKGLAQNEVRLQLNALAYNLGVFLQGTDLPEEMADWSLTSLQTRLIKVGARFVHYARTITFQLAEVGLFQKWGLSRMFSLTQPIIDIGGSDLQQVVSPL